MEESQLINFIKEMIKKYRIVRMMYLKENNYFKIFLFDPNSNKNYLMRTAKINNENDLSEIEKELSFLNKWFLKVCRKDFLENCANIKLRYFKDLFKS